jgi:hypothetical protein
MKTSFSVASLGALATGLWMVATSPASVLASGFYESLDNHNNFIVAHGWGPARWGKLCVSSISFFFSKTAKSEKKI